MHCFEMFIMAGAPWGVPLKFLIQGGVPHCCDLILAQKHCVSGICSIEKAEG